MVRSVAILSESRRLRFALSTAHCMVALETTRIAVDHHRPGGGGGIPGGGQDPARQRMISVATIDAVKRTPSETRNSWPDGKRVGIIRWPEQAVNFTFGGPDLRTLLCCAHTSVYSLRVKVPGNCILGTSCGSDEPEYACHPRGIA